MQAPDPPLQGDRNTASILGGQPGECRTRDRSKLGIPGSTEEGRPYSPSGACRHLSRRRPVFQTPLEEVSFAGTRDGALSRWICQQLEEQRQQEINKLDVMIAEIRRRRGVAK